MFRFMIVVGVLCVLIGCNDDSPQFIDPPSETVAVTDYDDMPPLAERANVSSVRDFFSPRFPVSQTCQILDGRVATSVSSAYWRSCREAPLPITEATVESILRDLGLFWNSSFVPCECRDMPGMDCNWNAFVLRNGPGFIWYDAFLVYSLSEGESLVPVAYLMAHEAAHHIQWKYGYQYAFTIDRELGADCMAGYFLGYLSCTGQVDGVDVRASLDAICDAGDLPGTPWWDDNAHGTCRERIDETLAGISGYALRVPPKSWCGGN